MRLLLCFAILPLAGSFLTAILGRRIKHFSDITALISTCILFLFSLYISGLVEHKGMLIYEIGGWGPDLGICLVADGFASFMLVVVNLVSLLVMIYSISYMNFYTDKWKFHALFLLLLAGLNGVIVSGDLFNMYVFLELASISGYALVAFGVEPEDLEAAFKYAIMGAVASVFILLGITLIYSYTSTLNIADFFSILASQPRGFLIKFISILFLAGLGFKAALVPFHAWLPDAHSCAPSPVSAVLSGVFIKTLGIYVLGRIFFNVIGVSGNVLFVFMVLGAVSMVVGAFLAFAQNDIKRMFAYSSISQVGYIIFAFGVGTPLAIFGGLFHLANHAIAKSLLFLNAGAIEHSTGKRELNKLGGLNRKLPVTGFSSLAASMSISGIPPMAGFWSKVIIIIAAIQSGHVWFSIIAILVSIITLIYYLRFQASAMFGKPVLAEGNIKHEPVTMKIAMVGLGILCLGLGLVLLMPRYKAVISTAADSLVFPGGYSQKVSEVIK